jgi:4-hydroxybenzoyl-CoA thioesterase
VSGREFRHPVAVRFGACDPAGIVYFPRFFEWFHEAMEAWFDAELLRAHGLPAAKTEAAFAAPVRMGERVDVVLTVGHLGRSSLRLDYRVQGPAGDERARGSTTCVFSALDPAAGGLRPTPIPPALRAAMAEFLAPEPP